MTDTSTKAIAALQLVRWSNLAFIVLIQFVTFRKFIATYFAPEITLWYAVWIICFTVTAAAAGYIINDLLDTKADQINQRDNVLNANLLTPRFAIQFSICLLAAGIVSAIALAKWSWHFLLLYPFVTFFLWLYSRYFKKMVLLGNVAVSCFCAGAVLMFWYPGIVIEDKASFIAFGIFAFLLTMVREIVKDLEDVEGDRSVGDRTLPIVYGVTAAKVTGVFFLACTMAGLIISGLIPGLSLSLASVFWLAALGTMCYCAYRLLAKVAEKEDFHHISTLLKITMMIGVLYFLAT